MKAVISLSPESLPKVIRVPRRRAVGMVKTRKEGEMKSDQHQDICDVPAPGHDQFDQFQDLIHQKDDGKNHQADEEDGKNFFKNIEVARFSHFNRYYK